MQYSNSLSAAFDTRSVGHTAVAFHANFAPHIHSLRPSLASVPSQVSTELLESTSGISCPGSGYKERYRKEMSDTSKKYPLSEHLNSFMIYSGWSLTKSWGLGWHGFYWLLLITTVCLYLHELKCKVCWRSSVRGRPCVCSAAQNVW